ncbi:hypothetical protein QYE76_035569 [Lolium multiflorum]|uniref:Uncharacterized protein n=1 Tax=Lolium multiflorum TaxID=4521 RepID=A0AAD8QZY6_LOLMU|nr:hypothetical protein QYE76_035569 [Lolium multiflorum]
MRYVAPRKGKPFGLMPPSWDNSETSSQEDDRREARGTYEETTAHTSTTKKMTLNTRIRVKPMDEWGFMLKDEPTSPVKLPIRTKLRLSLLEKHQNHELTHREIVRRRLLDLAEKKELNRVVKAMTEAVNSTRYELQSAIRRISALEESNRKLRAAFSNAIPPP